MSFLITGFYVLVALLAIFWVTGYIVQDVKQKRIIKRLGYMCLVLFIIVILVIVFLARDRTTWWDDPYFFP